MKEVKIATGKMYFKLHLVFGLGFYIEPYIFRYDDHQMVKNVSYYFMCFKLNTTQHYRTFKF